jgi:hypothetical protein
VNKRGGNLYVWIVPFASSWQARADTEAPVSIDFDRHEAVADFQLWLERDAVFSQTVVLDRRWAGLRDGIVVTNASRDV